VRYTSPADAFRFIANYRLTKDSVDFGNVPLDDYEVLDLAMSYVVNETLEVHGRIQNATDETYQEVSGYNSAERATYAGVRVRF
jgi:vitamin B12 transporter